MGTTFVSSTKRVTLDTSWKIKDGGVIMSNTLLIPKQNMWFVYKLKKKYIRVKWIMEMENELC